MFLLKTKPIPLHRLFFYLLILFLPTQLGYHVWPAWSMVLGRKVDYLSPTLYFTDILLIITTVSWFLSSRKPLSALISRHNKTLLLLFLLVSTNMMFSILPINSILAWVKICELGILGYYIIRTRPDETTVTRLLLVAALFSSLLGIVQFIHQEALGGILWWVGERSFTISTPGIAKGTFCIPFSSQLSALSSQLSALSSRLLPLSCPQFLRPYATLPHPNVLAGFLGSVLLLFVPFSRLTYHARLPARQVSLFICFVAFLLTDSRSAILALGTTVVFFLLSKTSTRIFFIGASIGTALLLTVPVVPGLFSDYESVSVRQHLVGSAFRMVLSSPFFGVGLHNFLIALPTALVVRSVYFLQPVHNIYLLFLSEFGFVGCGILLLLLAPVLRRVVTILFFPPTDHKNRLLTTSWRYPLLFLLLVGLLDHYPVTIQQGQLLITVVISFFLVQTKTNSDGSA